MIENCENRLEIQVAKIEFLPPTAVFGIPFFQEPLTNKTLMIWDEIRYQS